MLFVLIYDVGWWLMTRGHHFSKLSIWTTINLATAILCAALHLVLGGATHFKVVECVIFLPVVIVSCIDMNEIFTQRELFGTWFARLGASNKKD